MLGTAILWIGLVAVGGGDYLRPFGEKAFDQATLDAESFGDKKALVRDGDGLRVTLKPGDAEAGWKTPVALRIGGDFSVSATIVIRKLPKPAQEDGAAIGLALATQMIDQPEATLLRELEPDGKDVYRPIDKVPANAPQMMNQQPMMMNRFGGQGPVKPEKQVRHTFPARGQTVRLEMRRQGQTLRYQVFDEMAAQPREIGQGNIGPGDVAGVKLFASNRNGAEPIDVLFRDLTIHADRLSGLGTAVRTIQGTVIHGDPTALDAGTLVVGGPPPPVATPPPGANPPTPSLTPPPTSLAVPVAPPAPPPGATVAVAIAPAAPPGAVVVDAPKPAALVTGELPKQVFATSSAKPTPPPPKARIPLDEVESITFERSSSLGARFLGQPNVDTTGPGGEPSKDAKDAKQGAGDDLSIPPPGTVAPPKILKVEPKPNGIRDLHLSLSSLRDAEIKQIVVQCQNDMGQASWQLDTSGSPAWPLTVRRAGKESWADVFLEPPAGDCQDKPITITLIYADGQNAKVQVTTTGHTNPKLAFDPAAPTPALDARVYLSDDEQLFGKLESITEDALGLTTPWGDRLDVPIARVVAVYMGMSDHKETPESFANRLKAQGGEDLLLVRAKDGEVVAIAGGVERAKDNKLTFVYQGKSRTLPLKSVEGLILAGRPEPKPPAEVRPTFSLAGGLVVSGRWDKIEANAWHVEAPWGQVMKLPAADVRGVRFRGGRMAYLSDLEPSKVEEIPYFGRRAPYRRDVNLDGAPLRLDGQVIDKGLAVHSRTRLTYDLDRRYATFEALVGFDDAAKKKGRVDCRVFADGKEVYANPDLRADAPPVKLVLPVTGAEQIQLVIDFGPDQDTGDRVIWGNARIYRVAPKSEVKSASTGSAQPPTTPSASGQ
ncbi:MAG: putative carbohydrate binding protein [Planctomycetota bacterium]|nr:putative carbohydrate binding protein [Planctomycetota bacterium]